MTKQMPGKPIPVEGRAFVSPFAGFEFRSSNVLASIIIIVGSCLLLFARLGHYALWDDEAITAMTARSVFHTLDTGVKVDDHNYLLYRNGLLVRNFHDRYTPPLQFYFLAPFIGLMGDSSFVCRLPVAICGLLTVGILLLWLRRLHPPPLIWWAAVIILLTNAEFFLFCRQCRYYGLAIFLTTAVAYLYCTRDGSFRRTIALAIALALLLAAQYLDYAAVVACLVVDYAVWGRRQPFGVRRWLMILLPQGIVGVVVVSIWNPLISPAGQVIYHAQNILHDRMVLLFYNWRDMLACDFVIVPLLGICPLLYFLKRSNWLLRTPLALVVFVSSIAMVVPTSLAQAHNAEVRYLAPALPLCIAVGIVAVWGLLAVPVIARWIMLGFAALSLMIQPGTTDDAGAKIECTAWMYYHELAVPQIESYTPVIDWINTHVPAGSSIYVQPAYKTYPLMLRAPKAIYAWQLTDPPRSDFKDMPDIHFKGRQAPDYLIRFARNDQSTGIEDAIHLMEDRGIEYEQIDVIHLNWQDLYRPERLWRSFVTVPPKDNDEIYIYRKIAE